MSFIKRKYPEIICWILLAHSVVYALVCVALSFSYYFDISSELTWINKLLSFLKGTGTDLTNQVCLCVGAGYMGTGMMRLFIMEEVHCF